MKEEQDRIRGIYLSTLFSFLSGAGEASLARAYEVGRSAMEERFGILKIAEAYVTALGEILKPISGEGARTVESTREFLSTTLAPFEMTHRGYQDSIMALRKANAELEKKAAELSAVNRELEAFSYSVSHDLQAPVRAIDGYTSMLKEDHAATLGPDGLKTVSRVAAAAAQMREMIEGMLVLGRIGRQDISVREVDLSGIVRDIIADLQRTDPQRPVRTMIADGVIVRGDPELLRSVMRNLLGNAWKFTSKTTDSVIEFGTTTRDEKTVIFLKDNGAGFDMRHADRLFEPFQRLHSANQFEGTGIGLATVRRIVERHNGRIWAESEVGKGTVFFLSLPS